MPLNDQQLDYQQRSARVYQERFDGPLRKIGMRAPQPVLGQDPNSYRREVLRTIKRTFLGHHELGKINMRGLPDEVFPQFEQQVIDAALVEAYNPKNNAPGETLRKIEELDDYGKVRQIRFVGEQCFTKQLGREGRRVVSFTTDKGRWDAAKGRWF